MGTTTGDDKAAPCPLHLVNRQVRAEGPNRPWASDFTYVATRQGFVHVASVIDAFARRIVGWRVCRARGACRPRPRPRRPGTGAA